MSKEITETLKEQIKNFEAEFNNPSTEQKRKLELSKLIEQNKMLLETTYRDLNKRNGISLRLFEEEINNKPIPVKRATGIKLLDDLFEGGFEEGMFINLTGESGTGKSTLGLEILINIAEFTPSVFFSFEMGDRLTLKKIQKIGIKESHRDNLIIDRFSRNIETLSREVSLYANDGIKFFVIDSKMKIEVDGKDDEYKKISYLSNKLSKCCAELGVIIILINQMSEESIKSGRVALKGSGDQRYDTDILLVYRKHKTDLSKRILYIDKDRQTEKNEGVSIETRLENNKTVAVGQVEVVEFGSDDDFLKDML